MFTIGDFARHGRVSVRMLRHYDAIGLLCPARVDRVSGYRLYEAVQLSRLNRVVALKGLGFTLQQVQAILDEDVSTEELRGMLRLRRAELETALAETAADLVQVEARLRSIESEGAMPQEDVVVRPLPAVRLAELSGTAASFDPGETGPLINRLFAELRGELREAGAAAIGPRTVCPPGAGHRPGAGGAAGGSSGVESSLCGGGKPVSAGVTSIPRRRVSVSRVPSMTRRARPVICR
jgi:DNA-binding transcriptional MerR regulator